LGLVLAVGAAIIYFLAGKGENGSAAFEPVILKSLWILLNNY